MWMIRNVDDGLRRGRKEDIWWDYLFDKYDILNHINKTGEFRIDADTINSFCDPRHTKVKEKINKSEARLMTKWDTTKQLPNIFKENNITMLSTGLGQYILGRFSVYNELKTTPELLLEDVKEMELPKWLTTLTPSNISTETDAVNAAEAAGVFKDFLGESEMYQTASGRTSSGALSFDIRDMNNSNKYRIDVQSAQVEIDASFETRKNFYIVEAKHFLVDDFLGRQLFYPYQLWQKQVTKEVFPVYVQYKNDIINLSLFRVDKVDDYNSMQLVKRQNYKII